MDRLMKWQHALHLIATAEADIYGRAKMIAWLLSFGVDQLPTHGPNCRPVKIKDANDDSHSWIMTDDLCIAVAKEALFGEKSSPNEVVETGIQKMFGFP